MFYDSDCAFYQNNFLKVSLYGVFRKCIVLVYDLTSSYKCSVSIKKLMSALVAPVMPAGILQQLKTFCIVIGWYSNLSEARFKMNA